MSELSIGHRNLTGIGCGVGGADGRKSDDFPIADSMTGPNLPSLTSANGEYGLSWLGAQNVGNKIAYLSRRNVAGERMSSDLPINGDATSNPEHISLVWNGSEYAVSWNDFTSHAGYNVYFADIDLEKNKIKNFVRITNDTANETATPLVWNGSSYAVSWIDHRQNAADVYFARITKKLTP